MMGWTDRHARYFLRLITGQSLLYTEMVNTGALLHNTQKVGSQKRLLAFNAQEHPLALQLGGSDPQALALSALMVEDAGFDEVNLNVGCPSDRVKSGNFGACLMAQPELVADSVFAMKSKVSIPVTVKCRIGIDDMEGYPSLENFINTVAEAGCDTFIVHARKAWLKGLSPKQNREIPPLKYDYVYRLKSDKPELNIVINGGIKTIESMRQQLEHVDGVMIGRQAYQQPYFLAELEHHLRPEWTPPERQSVVEQMMAYAESELGAGEPLARISRHMMGLFAGLPGARAWRRYLSENAYRKDAGPEVLLAALETVHQAR